MKDNLSYQQYEPPEIVVCQAEVELGFAGSETGATTPGRRPVTGEDDYF